MSEIELEVVEMTIEDAIVNTCEGIPADIAKSIARSIKRKYHVDKLSDMENMDAEAISKVFSPETDPHIDQYVVGNVVPEVMRYLGRE